MEGIRVLGVDVGGLLEVGDDFAAVVRLLLDRIKTHQHDRVPGRVSFKMLQKNPISK